MTYGQLNIDQSDLRDERQDGMGYGAQPEQGDLGGQPQDVAGYGMQAADDGFGEEQRQSVWAAAHEVFGQDQRQDVTGFGAQASPDPDGTEQPQDRADYGEQPAPAGYGDAPQGGGLPNQWR